MDSFLPLTVLGAIIGIYAILPEYKKLRLGYSFGILDKILLITIILVMLSSLIFSSYITDSDLTTNFYLILKQNHLDIFGISSISLIQEQFSFRFLIDVINIIIVLFLFLLFYSKISTKNIRINNQEYFTDIIDEFFYKGEYTTAISLINDNFKNLMYFNKNIYSKANFKTKKRMDEVRKLVKANDNEKPSLSEILKKKQSFIKWYFRIYLNKIIRLIGFKKDYSDLKESIETRLLDNSYIESIVNYNPYFGLKIITDKKISSSFREDFANFYFKELMRNENSVLYREIQNTWDLSGNRYNIYKYNRIMYQVLYNIDSAYETTVYKPIGDLTLELLELQQKKPNDEYNDYIGKLMEYSSERLNNPLFMAIHFFDIMIREAIYQKLDWHMWLFYYTFFVKAICENFKITEDSDPEYEFPNVYSFLLFEIIRNLLSWIAIIKKDTDKVHKKLNNLKCDHDNANLIKSSIICLKECLKYILEAEEIPSKLKLSILNSVFRNYFDLVLNDNIIVKDYGTVLENCLLSLGKDSTICKGYFNDALHYIAHVEPHHLPNKPNALNKLEESQEKFKLI